LPRDQLWVIPYQEVPKTAGCRAIGVHFQTLG
jgi:hypothetical protein